MSDASQRIMPVAKRLGAAMRWIGMSELLVNVNSIVGLPNFWGKQCLFAEEQKTR